MCATHQYISTKIYTLKQTNTKMACWSAENATKAYLRALKMGKRDKEPDVSEFISALAAGKNAQLMVVATAAIAGSSTLSLVAAARQTGGRVVCILPSLSNLNASKAALGPYSDSVKFVIGDAKTLLPSKDYKGTDFVLIDCHIGNYKEVYKAAEECLEHGSRGIIVGYNAFHKGSPWTSQYKTHLLPIGEGLVVSRISNVNIGQVVGPNSVKKWSKWVTTIDKCTGEEHVYRVSYPTQKTEA